MLQIMALKILFLFGIGISKMKLSMAVQGYFRRVGKKKRKMGIIATQPQNHKAAYRIVDTQQRNDSLKTNPTTIFKKLFQ